MLFLVSQKIKFAFKHSSRLAFKRRASSTTAELIYCDVGIPARNLTTDEVFQNLTCIQGEADTALFTLYGKLRSEVLSEAVAMDTEDTDNYIQAAYVAQQTSGLLCLKRKSKLISAQCLCDTATAESLIPLHVLTGCDHNSSFYGVGKKTTVDRVEKSSEAHNLLKSCGTILPVTQEIIDDLQKFVIWFIFHDTKHKTLAKARAAKWSVLKKKNIIRLVPDSDSLLPHLECTNYLTLPASESSITNWQWMTPCKWLMPPSMLYPTCTSTIAGASKNSKTSASEEQR